jgi:glycosyltransferase involved in cell wall biosynthesis
MACGTPVLISETKGFWDYENFINNQNIFFISKNNLQEWIGKISLVLDSPDEKYINYSNSCKETVIQHYSMDNINLKLENFIENL